MDTPEFLVWAIEHPCPIRGFQNGSDPERTERQLRAARAVSDAHCEGRVFEGLCVDPPNGFRIDDALAIYGGLNAVEQSCGPCQANAAAPGLAGCFGILPLTAESQIVSTVEVAIDRLNLVTDYIQLFAPTHPRWYGFWMCSPLELNQLLFLSDVFKAIEVSAAGERAWGELQIGLEKAIGANLPIHATLFPRGRVEGAAWRLAPHCPRCKARWDEKSSERCTVCGYTGHSAADKKRKARGTRPYFPLDRLLGDQAAADFLVRYEAFRGQLGSTAPVQNQLREGH